MITKCFVLVMGHGYLSDGEWEPVMVFTDKAAAERQLQLLEEIMKSYADICGEPHKIRIDRLAKAEAEAPAKYAALGYPEAKGGAWWQLYEVDVYDAVTAL